MQEDGPTYHTDKWDDQVISLDGKTVAEDSREAGADYIVTCFLNTANSDNDIVGSVAYSYDFPNPGRREVYHQVL